MFCQKNREVLGPPGPGAGGQPLLPLQQAAGAGGQHCLCCQFAELVKKLLPNLQGQVRVRQLEEASLAAAAGAGRQFLQFEGRQQPEKLPGFPRDAVPSS